MISKYIVSQPLPIEQTYALNAKCTLPKFPIYVHLPWVLIITTKKLETMSSPQQEKNDAGSYNLFCTQRELHVGNPLRILEFINRILREVVL